MIIPWKGNLGHWYWNVQSNDVVFNPLKAEAIGYKKEDLPEKAPYDFFTSKLHPDDYGPVMDNMMEHLKGNHPVYEVEYRIRTKERNWKWYYDRDKVTKRDKDGTPLFLSGIVFDVTHHKEKVGNLEELTSTLIDLVDTDDLTQIRNRPSILREVKSQIVKTGLEGNPLVIAMLDIDNFKSLNDTKGHVFGDYVLKETAGTLANTLENKGCVGRYGGEEFLVVLPKHTLKEAMVVLNKCRDAVSANEFLINESITISGGFSIYTPDHSLESFVKEADTYLYKAKETGKNIMICSES